MSALIRLYPRAWRERYEAEFLGLLEARPPSLRDRVDILRGAFDARLHHELPGSSEAPGGMRPAVRVAAIAAVAGALWLAWMAVLQLLFRGWDAEVEPDYGLLAATPILAGLGMAVAHAAVVLAAGAAMRPGAVLAASLTAVGFGVAALGGGMVLLAAMVGSAIVAVDGIGRILPTWLRLAWVASAVGVIVVMLAFVGGGGRTAALLAGGIPFGVVWLLIAIVLAMRGVPEPDPEPASQSSSPTP